MRFRQQDLRYCEVAVVDVAKNFVGNDTSFADD